MQPYMINRITPQHQSSLTYLKKAQKYLFKNLFFIAMVLFTSCASPPRITYEGEQNHEGKYHGQGEITFKNGDKWEGEFKNGQPFNGQGTYTYPDGRKYVGEFKDGEYNGQGTITYSSGETWTGDWVDDEEHTGRGTIKYKNGRKYVGEFKDGKKHGQGTYTYLYGALFLGEFKDDKWDGLGTLTAPNGGKYMGEFKDGSINGKGVSFNINGEIQSGTWTNNNFINVWTIEAVDIFLRNKYPQFKGLNYSAPITSVSSQKNEVYSPPSPDNLSFIAVIDFKGNNVTEGDCRAFTDRLRAELFNTKHYKVIEREMMELLIKEQGFQQPGCSTDECMVEVGKLIGVEKIVSGSINKVGKTYSVSSRIVNVETGEIETTGVYDHMGDIGELLTGDMKMVAYELIK